MSQRLLRPRTQANSVSLGRAAMSHEQIAALQGVSRCRVCQIERRAFQKIRRAVQEFADAAGVSPREWLWGEGRDPESAA